VNREGRGLFVRTGRRLFGISDHGTIRHEIGCLFVGTLGPFVLGLATLVIFTLTFGDCVSLFGNKSPRFVLSPGNRNHQSSDPALQEPRFFSSRLECGPMRLS
jgi:hypothetical protein